MQYHAYFKLLNFKIYSIKNIICTHINIPILENKVTNFKTEFYIFTKTYIRYIQLLLHPLSYMHIFEYFAEKYK